MAQFRWTWEGIPPSTATSDWAPAFAGEHECFNQAGQTLSRAYGAFVGDGDGVGDAFRAAQS